MSHHKPYSTFNFTNLLAWDLEDKRRVTFLNDNLVIEQIDRSNHRFFYTFIGNNKPVSTAKALLKYGQSKHTIGELRFISESVKKKLEKSDLPIEECRDDAEYLYDVVSLLRLEGSKLKSKRVLAKRFIHEHPAATFSIEDIHSEVNHREILGLIKKWSLNKKNGGKDYDYKNEKKALQRLLSNGRDTRLVLSCVRLNNVIIAFSIDEILPRKKAIGHFAKADTNYKGIYEYLNQQTAIYLLEQKVRLWNWQQDLGLEGLRRLKLSYQPAELLYKYKVTT